MLSYITDDSALTIEPTPERSATLKAGLEALLRTKELEQVRWLCFSCSALYK